MKELICIVCPKGCHLTVDEENEYTVTGNACPRGAEYGRSELLHPVRVVTSTVRITGATHRRCPVKTDGTVPKEKMMAVMEALRDIELIAPVEAGAVVLENAANIGVRVICTRSMQAI